MEYQQEVPVYLQDPEDSPQMLKMNKINSSFLYLYSHVNVQY